MRRIAVVGAGIVGLATARALAGRFPDARLTICEKEAGPAAHQTGHNSGVIHSGVYYRPGSLKARLCVDGRRRMLEYLDVHGVPVERCGKLVLATDPGQLPRLEELERRARANGVPAIERLDPKGIRRVEPEARGVAALWVPGTAITDYRAVARSLVAELENGGAELRFGCPITGGRATAAGVQLDSPNGPIEADFLVNCGGLYADRIAATFGVAESLRIVPFRGEYFHLRPSSEHLVRGLIYPVPDPAFPFLGVHFTRHVGGGVEAGPNAVLAMRREGYRRRDFDGRELALTLTHPGFYRVLYRHPGMAIDETYRSLDRRRFAADLARLVPAIRAEDLEPGGAGVRAQAVGADGKLLDDFELRHGPRSLHVLNAPSPAATASLAIGAYLAAEVPAD